MTTEPAAPPSPAALGLLGAARGGALEGVVVVELAETLAGEFAGGVLADLGATVIKVEPPEGSPLRRRGPGLPGEASLYFQSENRGKCSVVAAREDLVAAGWLAPLLASADAIVEDLGPGRLEGAGLSPDALHAHNPRLVILRISPFGQTGPLAGERGDDRIAQAFSGVQFTTGFPDRPPIPVALPLLDCWTGVHGANGLLMAIFHARRSGRGQVVDLGLYQIGLRVQEEVVVQHHRTGAVATRMGTESAFVVPANVYGTRDGGWIAVSGAGDQPFARLCEAVEVPEAPKDPRFATPAARLEHRAASNALVASWIARHDLAEVEARFFACGVTGTAIRSVDEIMADEHVRARGDLLSLSSETGRDFITPAPVPKLSRTPARNPEAAPRLGEHTDAVGAGLGAIAARPRVEAITARSPAGAGVGFGPLSGIRVLDLSQWLAGPVAATILAEFGADVIMVELPVPAPPTLSAPRPPAFRVTNRNKRSITLDVRSPQGRAVFLELVQVSDVIVENFRPGTLERWDLAPATLLEINPRLVLLRASGFGQTGPYAARAAFNPVGLAFGGATYLNGWPDRPPLRDGVTAGDYSTALFNVSGMLAALLRRDVDGQGQVVDTAMFEAVLRMTGDTLAARSALGIRRERAGGASPIYPCSITVEAADRRFVAVSAESWTDVGAALESLGRPRSDDPESVRRALAEIVSALPAEEVTRALRSAGLGASPVNSVADLVGEAHLWSRGDLVRRADPELGEVVMQGVVPLLSETPGRITGWSPAPGSDNDAVLGELAGLCAGPDSRVTEAAASAVRGPANEPHRKPTSHTETEDEMEVGLQMVFCSYGWDNVSDEQVWDEEIRLARLAADLGFDVLWSVEHHFNDYSFCPDNLQLMSYLAAVCPDVDLGTAAVILPWHDPLRVAEQASVLDYLSKGRLRLGMGRGLARREFEAFRGTMDESRGRFDEAAEMILRGLRTGFVEGNGQFYKQPRTEIRPRPSRSFDGRVYAVASSDDSVVSAAKLNARLVMFADRPWPMRMPAIQKHRDLVRQMHGVDSQPPLLADFCVCTPTMDGAKEKARQYMGKFVESNFYHYELLGEHFGTVKGYDAYAQKIAMAKEIGMDGIVSSFMEAAVWGPPDRILRMFEERRSIVGEFELATSFRFGGTPYDLAESGLRLYAKEVLPVVRSWKREVTAPTLSPAR